MSTPRPWRPLPDPQQRAMQRAVRLEWISVAILGAIAIMMIVVSGQSQAMKSAWVEDVLSLVPPVAFLVAARASRKPPDEEYIHGHARAFDVTYLVSAVALTGVGALLIYESLSALLEQEHASIGAVDIGGTLVWEGWLMMAALVVSSIPPVILGRKKLELAHELHLKPLHTDADMNKADWMTGVTGVVGIAGIGAGLWWMDAVAALVISASVLKDGLGNLKYAMRDMLDARPETTERGRGDPLVGRVRESIAALDWVEACEVRLHEEGQRVSGIVRVTPRDGRALATRLREAEDVARDVHWRIDEVVAGFGAAVNADDEAVSDAKAADTEKVGSRPE